MQKVKPENGFCYFNDFLTRKNTENIVSITIEKCIYFMAIKVAGYSKNYKFHCFKCQVCRMLISVLVKGNR